MHFCPPWKSSLEATCICGSPEHGSPLGKMVTKSTFPSFELRNGKLCRCCIMAFITEFFRNSSWLVVGYSNGAFCFALDIWKVILFLKDKMVDYFQTISLEFNTEVRLIEHKVKSHSRNEFILQSSLTMLTWETKE